MTDIKRNQAVYKAIWLLMMFCFFLIVPKLAWTQVAPTTGQPQYHFALAQEALDSSNLQVAMSQVDTALEFIMGGSSNDSALWADCLQMKGTLCYFQLKPREAISLFDSVLAIKMSIYGQHHIEIAEVYNNLGLCHNATGEYLKSIEYLDVYAQIVENLQGPFHQDLAKYHFNQSLNFRQLGEYDRAIQSILKAKDIRILYVDSMHQYIADYYSYIGDNYVNKEDWEKAIGSYQRAENIYLQVLPADHRIYGMHRLHFATAYQGKGDYKKAIESFLLAKKVRLKNFGFYDPQVSVILRKLAQIEIKLGHSEQANEYLDESLRSIGYLADPEGFSQVRRFRYLLATFDNKADFYRETESNVDSCLFYWGEAIRLIEFLRSSYKSHSTQVLLSSTTLPAFEGALDFAYEIYNREGQDSMLEFFNECLQSYQRNALRLEINGREALHFKGIPTAEIEREKELKNKILILENKLFTKGADVGLEEQANQKQAILSLKDSFENFTSYLEATYPNYYSLKYGDKDKTLSDLRSELDEGELFVQYFYGIQKSFSLACDQETCRVASIGDAGYLDSIILHYRTLITSAGEIEELSRTSSILYDLLLKEHLEIFSATKQIIIRPDGKLALVPFESFNIQSASEPAWLNKYYTVHYQNVDPIDQPSKKQRSLLAFAPDYSNVPVDDGGQNSQDDAYAELVRSGQLALPGALQEATAVSDLFDGELILGDHATESRFKNLAPHADILHLSMHATINHEEPLKSKLLFDPVDQEDDGFLHAFELYNLDLDAHMVVLSACNTGFGKVSRGEGAMSLSRAFSYAGVPSLLMSLWKIPDDASAKIIIKFYENLQEGMDKAGALQDAKIHYLENVLDPAERHPFFWAGLILSGDNSPIAAWNVDLRRFVLLGLLFLVIGVGFWKIGRGSTKKIFHTFPE